MVHGKSESGRAAGAALHPHHPRSPTSSILQTLFHGLLVLVLPAPERVSSETAVEVHVVVLGSSTAEGVGASHPDSAWVNRYRRHARRAFPGLRVTNLARGGYTTYHLLPDGRVTPPGRPAPDPERNISQAVRLHPDAIVINLPSNDAAYGHTVGEQLENYDEILATAAADKIDVWVTTTQPRNLSVAGRRNLMAVRDSTHARYGDFALDFWTTLATAEGTIAARFDSGDGIHLNDRGHAILCDRVLSVSPHARAVVPR